MLKDILIKSAELLNRDDIINELLNQNNIQNSSLQNDILRLISYYNYTIKNLCQNYFPIEATDIISSDKNRKIYYTSFSFEPLKILSVTSNEKFHFYQESTTHILVPSQNKIYEVKYTYLPEQITDLNSKEKLPRNINEKIIIYGIISEFLASKNMLEESKFWNNKFMLEIYKSRVNSNKRLKATFKLWAKKNFIYFLSFQMMNQS